MKCICGQIPAKPGVTLGLDGNIIICNGRLYFDAIADFSIQLQVKTGIQG